MSSRPHQVNENEILTVGFSYPSYEIEVTAQDQRRKLECCNVDPTVFGDRVDITAYAMEGIMAARRAGLSINGSVHVTQEFSLREPIRLGERLRIRGEVTGVEPESRGRMLESAFELCRDDGSVPLRVSRRSLRMDPALSARAARPDRGARPPSEAFDTSDFSLEATRQLEPEKVARYSIEAQNLIHSDPQVAQRFGFKAPIAGGLMAVRMMMAVLAERGPIGRLEMSVRFRRPMFWSDTLRIFSHWDSGRLVVINPDQKLVNEARIDLLEHG